MISGHQGSKYKCTEMIVSQESLVMITMLFFYVRYDKFVSGEVTNGSSL